MHELIFCSMLMETEFKRIFALEFTKVKKVKYCKETNPRAELNTARLHVFSTLRSYRKTS